jgi:ABC-type nitrate/sulfonate/bicarbonate transport system ATPase subunit
MVFQEPTLLPWRNIFQNVVLAAGCSPEKAQNALDQVELGHRLEAFPGQLSLGQRRRVALARALAADPQILILDEAFSSLDEATALRMRQLTRDVLDRHGFRAIIVTHNIEEAVDLADRILLLDGSPAEILLDHKIEVRRGQRDLAAELARLKEPLKRAASDAPGPQVTTHRTAAPVARRWRILPVRPKA